MLAAQIWEIAQLKRCDFAFASGRPLSLRTRRPCTGVKIHKIRKRGFQGQKTPISHQPGKGHCESENAHFSTGHHRENGDFLTQIAPFRGGGKWGFFDPDFLFSWFCGFLTPVQGRRVRNTKPTTKCQRRLLVLEWLLGRRSALVLASANEAGVSSQEQGHTDRVFI